MHGIIEEEDLMKEETTSFVTLKIEEFDFCVLQYTQDQASSSAYLLALQQQQQQQQQEGNNNTNSIKEYIHQVKIQCLRSESFHVHNASKRFMNYFERKRQLFGEKVC